VELSTFTRGKFFRIGCTILQNLFTQLRYAQKLSKCGWFHEKIEKKFKNYIYIAFGTYSCYI